MLRRRFRLPGAADRKLSIEFRLRPTLGVYKRKINRRRHLRVKQLLVALQFLSQPLGQQGRAARDRGVGTAAAGLQARMTDQARLRSEELPHAVRQVAVVGDAE